MSVAHHLTRVKESLWRDDDTQIYYGISKRGGRWKKKSLHTDDRKLAEKRLAVFLRGDEVPVLPAGCERDVAAALAALQPHGASLQDAAEYYVKHALVFRQTPTISEAVEQLLDEKRANNRRARTLEDYAQRWGKFASEFGNRHFGDVTVAMFTTWLNKLSTSATNRHNYRRKVDSLYRVAVRRKWCADNIVAATEPVRLEETVCSIFTVEECSRLLATSDEYGMTGYVTLGLFCGLRSCELKRLPAEAVDARRGWVRLGPGVAGKRSQRLIKMLPAAATWYREHSGAIYEKITWRERFEAWRTAAGISRWPKNGLRHSFATYHLAMYNDEKRTQALMGHRDADVLHRHYKALVTKAEARRFWNLRPGGSSSKIVPVRFKAGKVANPVANRRASA